MKTAGAIGQMPPLTKTLIIVASVIAVVGVVVLINGKVQQADPTLTAAPVSAPSGQPLQALQPSGQKKLHPGPMYSLTAAGPTLNTAVGGNISAVATGGYPANTVSLNRPLPTQYQRPKQ